MAAAHTRLQHIWNALEARGAHTQRVPLHTITAHTANRLATAEERRLRILADADQPGPAGIQRRNRHVVDDIADLASLVHHAIKEAS